MRSSATGEVIIRSSAALCKVVTASFVEVTMTSLIAGESLMRFIDVGDLVFAAGVVTASSVAGKVVFPFLFGDCSFIPSTPRQ